MKMFLNFVLLRCYTGTYWKRRRISIFWLWLKSSYLGFRPFFGFPFLARNSKTAHFWDIVPILSSHFFFNFLSDGLFTFLGGWGFLKTSPIIAIQSPRSSEFDAVRKIYLFWKKTVASVNFHFRAIDNGGWDGCRNGGRKQWGKEKGCYWLR